MSLWAKTFADDGGVSPLPLFKPVLHHLLDVAAVAAAFLRMQPQRLEREARRAGMDPNAYVPLMSLLAGMHDLGKCSRAFQSLRLDLWPSVLGPKPSEKLPGPPHWQVSAALLALPHRRLQSWFRQLFPRVASGSEWGLIAAIAGHHGSPPPGAGQLIEDAKTALDRES
jgi:CRISPR-associated endonuclease/helicase Cas3